MLFEGIPFRLSVVSCLFIYKSIASILEYTKTHLGNAHTHTHIHWAGGQVGGVHLQLNMQRNERLT